jgi:YhcH/YjgK/YiaL family protein
MIYDTLDNFKFYSGLHPSFSDIQLYLEKTDLSRLDNGRHSVNESGAYASVNEYMTKTLDECFIECHQKYIDIQIIVYGDEKIGVASTKHCIGQPYDQDKDLQKLSGDVDFIKLIPGMFMVFFPHDAHEPNVISGVEPVRVKKIVFKVPVKL